MYKCYYSATISLAGTKLEWVLRFHVQSAQPRLDFLRYPAHRRVRQTNRQTRPETQPPLAAVIKGQVTDWTQILIVSSCWMSAHDIHLLPPNSTRISCCCVRRLNDEIAIIWKHSTQFHTAAFHRISETPLTASVSFRRRVIHFYLTRPHQLLHKVSNH